MADFLTVANVYCEGEIKSNWKNISDAKQKCFERKDCGMLIDQCRSGTDFWYCPHDDKVLPSVCGSIVYKSGKISMVIAILM